jgi:cell wall-associated NlpC family hydrolase
MRLQRRCSQHSPRNERRLAPVRLLLGLVAAGLIAFTPVSPVHAGSQHPDRALARERKSERKQGDAVASTALQYVGYPYRWGGSSPATGFDCSGFSRFVFGTFGLDLPHDQWGQLRSGRSIPVDELLPGDVLIFQNTYTRGPSHSGIYVGDGNFVHAADERHGVIVSSLGNSYWSSHYYAAARPGR